MNSSIIITFLIFCLVFIVCFNVYEVETVKVSNIIKTYVDQFQCNNLMSIKDFCNGMEMEVIEMESIGNVKRYQRIFKINVQSSGCSTSSGSSTTDILKSSILDYKPLDQFNDLIFDIAKNINCEKHISDTFYKIKYNPSKKEIYKIIIDDIYDTMENVEIEVNNNIHNTCIEEIQNFISQVDNVINHPIEDIAKYMPKPDTYYDSNIYYEFDTYYDIGYTRHALRVLKEENKSCNEDDIKKWCETTYLDIEE